MLTITDKPTSRTTKNHNNCRPNEHHLAVEIVCFKSTCSQKLSVIQLDSSDGVRIVEQKLK